MKTSCTVSILNMHMKEAYIIVVEVSECNLGKHFTKMQKHDIVGLASTKKTTNQDGTHMTIRSQIGIPASMFPTTHTIIPYSLFWNGCVYLCVVNSGIGLWGLWVGVGIEGSRE